MYVKVIIYVMVKKSTLVVYSRFICPTPRVLKMHVESKISTPFIHVVDWVYIESV
jgi:hypothetical protein